MKTNFLALVVLFFSLAVFSCRNPDSVPASLIGEWEGTKINIKLDPAGPIPTLPLGAQPLEILIVFNESGNFAITEKDSTAVEGRYGLSGKILTLSTDYKIDIFELSGAYEILELTDDALRLQIKREKSFTDPDDGKEYQGEVTAKLSFARPIELD